jgi:16S rRNA processing protein RimM
MCSGDCRGRLESNGTSYGAIARVLRPFGLNGWVNIELTTDVLSLLDTGQTIFVGSQLRQCWVLDFVPGEKSRVLLSNCNSRDEAESLQGLELYVDRAEAISHLDGRFFQFQIEGLEVHTQEGAHLGTVIGIIETGANDVYIIKGVDGEVLVPAIHGVIQTINLNAGLMVVTLPDGLIPEAE